ncbi:hypothetical protein [Shewanella sedimentimangrovi]|uniref:Uncharacterized protein n=1 Tax=Shewanella sedimentimangrovi TaxID=2814293 RepID=A0ABX7R4W5_9GAMM|nr:hypothetical protein [Shewanella sedimentimangrovi]QSX37821.1 hypothetical protein JYB85_02975 [Shewanella sedimentimangrovi]
MNKFNKKVRWYNFFERLAHLGLAFSFLYVCFSGTFSVPVRIVLVMLLMISLFVIQGIKLNKISQMKCPNCGAYVMTECAAMDQRLETVRVSECCYKCHFKFD